MVRAPLGASPPLDARAKWQEIAQCSNNQGEAGGEDMTRLRPAMEARQLPTSADSQSAGSPPSAGSQSSANGFIVLDLSEPAVQTSETACWLLSTIEGLRSSGQLQTLTARDVVVQTDGPWITSAGRTGC